MRSHRWTILFAMLAIASCVCWGSACGRAADEPSTDKAADGAADKNSAEKSQELNVDSLTVPNGNAEELQKFIDKVSEIKVPRVDSPANPKLKDCVPKTRTAILQAAHKILASNPQRQARIKAIHEKLSALIALMNYADDPNADKELRAMVASLKSDKDADVA